MKSHARTACATALLAAASLMSAAPAAADHPRSQGAVYDYARVIQVDPIVRYVTVRTPARECWDEQREYRVDRGRRGGSAGGALLGAIIGGVVGHQFGSGNGNDAATAVGALVGAAVGSGAGADDGHHAEERYTRPVRRCRTNYTTHEEERIDGYEVTYRYKGQKYRTRMPYDPGERLRIRVDVRPAQ